MVSNDNAPFDPGDQIHRAAHAFDHFSGDHPVCEIPILGHFHRAQDRQIDMPASDHRKAGRAIEKARTR